MNAHRELFWEIDYGWTVYILAGIVTALIAYVIYARIRLWKAGRPDNRLGMLPRSLGASIETLVTDVIGHRRLFRDPYSGLMHLLLFIGALLLLVTTAADAFSHYAWEFMEGNTYLAFSVVGEVGGLLLLVGLILALIRRYLQKPDRLNTILDDGVALALIFIVVLSGFILEGLRIAVTQEPGSWTGAAETAKWEQWSFVGYGWSQIFEDADLNWYRGVWWFHMVFTMGTIVYITLSFSKLTHMLISPVNMVFRSLGPKGALSLEDTDIAEPLGASRVERFTWKQLMDLDACTRCGRCQDACPAYFCGKLLSPKKVVSNLKDHLYETHPLPLQSKHSGAPKDMASEVITHEVIWDCTTCRACSEACPIYIEHPDKIVDMRRSLVDEGRIPATTSKALDSLSALGNPWEHPPATRTDWTGTTRIPIITEQEETDVLYWVGCAGSFDPVAQQISTAMASVLSSSGIKYAILGTQERCCGSEARRLGEEGLFQKLAQGNIRLFQSHGVKKILVTCPHCYNTFKNEYPQLGGVFEVQHHSEFLGQLIDEGTIQLTREVNQQVTFHDSCYLGRYNGLYDAPRRVLESVPGLQLVEMWRNREQGFCCGGGGGQLWLEGIRGERLNYVRFKDAEELKVRIFSTACPFCKIMFDDAASMSDSEERIRVQDIAELIQQAL